ncbi:hypothetical protein BC936DRAFT_144290 [Jimgerdemannia flammicorona]|uniref:Uncharacterized protein n=1 Tax=Jimgerdemannia flammicorona TaxID=994334 RepID=A0A433DCP3_9FUNG|nr:hypothetical protein BC936DRAFT_144290 [Jimgerdemannia flammicorona]
MITHVSYLLKWAGILASSPSCSITFTEGQRTQEPHATEKPLDVVVHQSEMTQSNGESEDQHPAQESHAKETPFDIVTDQSEMTPSSDESGSGTFTENQRFHETSEISRNGIRRGLGRAIKHLQGIHMRLPRRSRTGGGRVQRNGGPDSSVRS